MMRSIITDMAWMINKALKLHFQVLGHPLAARFLIWVALSSLSHFKSHRNLISQKPQQYYSNLKRSFGQCWLQRLVAREKKFVASSCWLLWSWHYHVWCSQFSALRRVSRSVLTLSLLDFWHVLPSFFGTSLSRVLPIVVYTGWI